MLLQKRFGLTLSRYCPVVLKLSCSDSALIRPQLKLKALVEENSSRVKKKPFEKHFVESLFLNKFQEKVLEYPELDTLEEVEALKKHAILAQKLITGKVENKNTQCAVDSVEAVSVLKKLEFSGFKIPLIKNGFGYLTSEYTYMQEALSVNPSLSKTIKEHEDFGIFLIDSFGSDIQKEQYLVKLINGEYIVSLANLEKDDTSFLKTTLNTCATLSSDNQSYQISGEKSWVYNANYADLFILSANIIDPNGNKAKKPTLFLVDKSTPGVVVHEPIGKVGLKKLTVCNVSFNNVMVPSSCVLGNVNEGNEIIKTVLSKGALSNGAHCLAIMKKLLEKSVTHCIFSEFFNADKCDTDYFMIKIGQMVSRIYAVESMTYLLTGRLDSHTDSDVFLESLIVKIFASESLLFIVRQTMEILGPEFVTSDENFVDISGDSQFYFACEDANDNLKLILSTAGINFSNNCSKNIFEKISETYRKTALLWRNKDHIYSKDILKGYLHRMFSFESRILEGNVNILWSSTQFLMSKYGSEVFDRHSELRHLADILINIYVMAATLGRASRAYCIGVRNQKVDEFCAEIETVMCTCRIRKARDLIKTNISPNFNSIASSILKSSKYSDRYSVIRNLMMRCTANSRTS